jgi:hypothetical protein
LNPNEDDDDEDNDDSQPEPVVLDDAPGPKRESGRQKKPALDRIAAVASVGVVIKEGLMGLGDLVKQALASAPRIGDQTEVINDLKLQAQELKPQMIISSVSSKCNVNRMPSLWNHRTLYYRQCPSLCRKSKYPTFKYSASRTDTV